MAKIYGLKTISNIIGKSDYDLYSPELANPVVNLDRAILKTGEGRQVEEVGFDSENRKAIYLSIKVPTKDGFGNLNGLIGISIDMSDVKRV